MNDTDIATQEMKGADAGPAGAGGLVLSPAERKHGFVFRVLGGLLSLLQGMAVTLKYFLRPWTVVTRQYPENRATLKMYERFRSNLVMTHDQDGFHNCTACGICQTACPNASINVVTAKDAAGKRFLRNYVWRMDACTFCNACVQACPFGAIAMGGNFENAVYDRRLLTYSLNRYSGPPANALRKVVDPAERQKLMVPCSPYADCQAPADAATNTGDQ
ncbi:MAG: 4Fe-4S binding protein [bacterium]